MTTGYPVTENDPEKTLFAGAVAGEIVGEANVDTTMIPSMGAEDFSFMLEAKPGAFARLGQGGAEGGCFLHNSTSKARRPFRRSTRRRR